MYSRLSDYIELYAFATKRRVSVAKYAKQVATRIVKGSNTLFGVSLVCCCCFSRASLRQAEIGDKWQQALAVYDNIDQEFLNKIFFDALVILKEIEDHCQRIIDAPRTAPQYETSTLMYTVAQIHETVARIKLRDDRWFEYVFEELRKSLYTWDGTKLDISVNYIPLTEEQKNILLISLPLFYPASVSSDLIIELNEKDKQTIASYISKHQQRLVGTP